MGKKNKFDLKALVNKGYVKNGDVLVLISDETKSCVIVHHPGGEYKVQKPSDLKSMMTVSQFVQECLGMEPTDHYSKWLKAPNGKTLFDLWHADDQSEAA